MITVHTKDWNDAWREVDMTPEDALGYILRSQMRDPSAEFKVSGTKAPAVSERAVRKLAARVGAPDSGIVSVG